MLLDANTVKMSNYFKVIDKLCIISKFDLIFYGIWLIVSQIYLEENTCKNPI